MESVHKAFIIYPEMFRAIEVCTDLTERKKAIIKDVLTSYRKTAEKIASYQWKLFFQTGAFNRIAKVKHIQSDLSERYKYTIQYHSVVLTSRHEYEITQEERLLAKKIFKHVLGRWKKPSFRKVSLLVDSKCGLLESPKKAKHFDYWIRLSTKEKGKPIYLPVKLHEYFHSKTGTLRRGSFRLWHGVSFCYG